ncbi:alpha/beta hydrolase domain-containing protein [Nocardia takedensis]|uniref:alpha/beta hydrolase domain-containing protein n=1 Tax=Nocardia takedensis TaxID=259390 RepID=UPI00278C4828|nr:alpha/beta hydrolase domain-containing protein [Nocardia takedensis]
MIRRARLPHAGGRGWCSCRRARHLGSPAPTYAAIARLHDWVGTGLPAPSTARITVSDGRSPVIVTDDDGIARGGVRTPWVDTPLAVTSGLNTESDRMATLFGSGELFDAAHLARRYPGGRTDYLTEFTAALDRAIGAGFLVSADRQEILDLTTITAGWRFDAE